MPRSAARAADPQLVAAAQYGASESDLSLIEQFKARVRDFMLARGDLQRLGAQLARTTNDETTLRTYGELVARADAIESKVSAATRAIDGALSAARAALGLSGLRSLAALGVVWLLPVAIIAGAIAILGYWLADYAKFAARYREQQRVASELVAQGVDPIEANRQAAQVVAASAPQGIADAIGTALKWGVVLLAGYYVWSRYRA